MERSLGWRIGVILSSILISVMFLVPSVVSELPGWWNSYLPSQGLYLGLDLRGGIHMVLDVEVDKAVENTTDLLMQQIRADAREKEIATRDWRRDGESAFSFDLVSRTKQDALVTLLQDYYGNVEPAGGNEGRRLAYRLVPEEIEGIRQLAVDQALETIRNRIDEFGVAEPTIQRTGPTGILIQLPGVQDPERAKRLIGRTAQLEFRMVSDDPASAEMLDEVIYDSFTQTESTRQLPVERTVAMTGDVISDARHRPGQFGEAPYVSITLNGHGASVFERLTEQNVGRRMAIVLDGKVQSAPTIQERIGGGRASITGIGSLDEARDLAIVLRAGALPAPVSIAEERTVGPSLGRDSIESGRQSFIVGGVLVLIFMLIYYRFAGFVADAALALNVLVLLGCLAGFQATLTLPGIAGMVLTLGMAVDANVLINERIREELRRGQTAHAALESGYSRALPAILDSNLTTFIAGLILFQFGSGPIKGFALTLCFGIATTIFSAVFCSRVLHDLSIRGRQGATLSI